MQIVQISSFAIKDTKMYEAKSDSTEKFALGTVIKLTIG